MKTIKQVQRESDQLFRFCLVKGSLDEGRARQVVQNVIDARRHGGLAVLSRFLRLVKLDRLEHTAEVESAVPLGPAVRADVEASLSRLYGPDVGVSFADNPALIGGVRIKVGSNVY